MFWHVIESFVKQGEVLLVDKKQGYVSLIRRRWGYKVFVLLLYHRLEARLELKLC